jgi:hypothetical protein
MGEAAPPIERRLFALGRPTNSFLIHMAAKPHLNDNSRFLKLANEFAIAILRAMADHPLYLRLYFNKLYIELARMIGYNGIAFADAQEHVKVLAKRFSKDKIQVAVEAIAKFDNSVKPPMVFLNDEARKLCWQMLGPPPEYVAEHHDSEKAESHTEKAKPRRKSRGKGG